MSPLESQLVHLESPSAGFRRQPVDIVVGATGSIVLATFQQFGFGSKASRQVSTRQKQAPRRRTAARSASSRRWDPLQDPKFAVRIRRPGNFTRPELHGDHDAGRQSVKYIGTLRHGSKTFRQSRNHSVSFLPGSLTPNRKSSAADVGRESPLSGAPTVACGDWSSGQPHAVEETAHTARPIMLTTAGKPEIGVAHANEAVGDAGSPPCKSSVG